MEGRVVKRDPGEGGFIWNWFYRNLAGPASVQHAIQGSTEEARALWKQDLENRRRHDREQRAKRAAARDQRQR
jgi:hypothetical protein